MEFVSNVYLAGGEKVIHCNIRDITERKQAQESISILKTADDARYRAKHEGRNRVVVISKQSKPLGFSLKPIIKTNLFKNSR